MHSDIFFGGAPQSLDSEGGLRGCLLAVRLNGIAVDFTAAPTIVRHSANARQCDGDA